MTAPTIPSTPEAPLTDNGSGLEPTGPGWWIMNVADAAGWYHAESGYGVGFDSDANRFSDYGFNIHVVQPGQPSCKYHFEQAQETYIVLSGQCTVVVEDEERTMRAGDVAHFPPYTRHVAVGAGDVPCAILMIGTRGKWDETCGYPPSEVAARHGASVAEFTREPAVAYAGESEGEDRRVDLSWIFDR